MELGRYRKIHRLDLRDYLSRRAFIVGINNYRHPDNSLDAAVDDAEAIAERIVGQR